MRSVRRFSPQSTLARGFLLRCGVIAAGLAAAPCVMASEMRAGAAHEAFVLPKHIPLAGYSRRGGSPSTGRHDPVGVRALVVQDAETTVALVSGDLLIIDERLFDAVRQRLIADGLPKTVFLLLAATHTHSGPGAYGTKFLEKLSMGHFDPAVFEGIVGTIAQAVARAHADLAPCRVAYGTAGTNGLVVNRMEAGGITDAEVAVCAFFRDRGEPFAVLVNFAAHPTTLGAWNRQLSADYPGVLARDVEQRFPASLCLFFAGAVADQGPVKSGEGFASAERLGGELSQRVVALVQDAVPEPAHTVEVLQEHVPLPPARLRLGRFTVPRWLGRWLVDDDATLTTVTVGRAVLIGVPCDLTAALGARLKQAARSENLQPMVIGFANDYIGYCLPEALYETRAYEALMTFNGPSTGELVTNRLTQMIGRLVTSDK